ncbi:reverse transcriptase domain-containing protein [Tanacetum coccineum]
MPEDFRVPIILGRPFLATARAMIDVFEKNITLRVGDDEVIFDVDQSIKRSPIEDDECYGIDDLDDTIDTGAQELLANDESDSFLLRGLEKSIDQSDLKAVNLLKETKKPDKMEREHLYLASANEIDEKKLELKDLPHHLEYAYLHGDKSFPIIILSKLSEKEKISLLQDFCLLKDAFWVMQRTCYFSKMHDDNFPRHGGRLYGIFMDDFLVFGIEVDRAKIDVIAKLPYQTNVKGVRNAKFDFFDDCKKAFNIWKEKLTTTSIIISPDWNIPFELMCDASDFAVGAVLGQRIDGKFKPIYYASKSLNNAQEHYTTTEKELLAVDAKLRLIRWVMLLQGFDIKIKDKRGAKNLVADHLLRIENPDLGTFTKEEIADEFPDLCHHSASITGRKVYESRFFWPNIFKDANDYVMRCDACQRSGNISSRSEMPQNNIQVLYGDIQLWIRAYWYPVQFV